MAAKVVGPKAELRHVPATRFSLVWALVFLLGSTAVPSANADELPAAVPGSVTVAAVGAAVEGGPPAKFEILREAVGGAGGIAVDTTVQFQLEGAPGADYSASALKEVVIPADSDRALIFIQAKKDLLTEGPESVTLRIIEGNGYVVGTPDSASLTIEDVPPNVISVSTSVPILTEGKPAESKATIRVQRTGSTIAALPVFLELAGNATMDDFSGEIPTTVTIPASQQSTSFDLSLLDDGHAEDREALTISVLPVEFDYVPSSGSARVTVEVVDNDLPTVAIFATGVLEETFPVKGTFTVSRVGTVTAGLAVAIRSIGTAKVAGDSPDAQVEGIVAGKVHIPAGQQSAEVIVKALRDGAREGPEEVRFELVPATHYQLGVKEAALQILDADLPVVTVTADRQHVREGANRTTRFTFERTDSETKGLRLSDPLAVDVVLSGTAQATDYSLSGVSAGKVFFAAGSATADVVLTVTDDLADEIDETVSVAVKADAVAPLEWQLGEGSIQILEILDDDQPDMDGDGKPADLDNCPLVSNSDQADADDDKVGDLCDDDDDNDLLSDAAEAAIGTNPKVADTDKDGRDDKAEVDAKTNPLSRFSPDYRAIDVQARDAGNRIEVTWNASSDSLAARYLIFRSSTPSLVGTVLANPGQTEYIFVDSGFPGGNHSYLVQAMLPHDAGDVMDLKVARKSAELSVDVCKIAPKDTDRDGLCDRQEVNLGTNPNAPNSDNDGFSDGDEVAKGTNPLAVASSRTSRLAIWTENAKPFGLAVLLVIGGIAMGVVASVVLRSRMNRL